MKRGFILKDTIKQVLEELKKEVKISKEEGVFLSVLVKLDSGLEEIDVLYIDDSEVSYLDNNRNLNKMKLKDFRLDLLRYNRDLVDYITKRLS